MGNINYDLKEEASFTTATTVNLTVNTPPGSGRLLVSTVTMQHVGSVSISAWTFDALPYDFTISAIYSSNTYLAALAYWKNPPIGAHTLSITFDSANAGTHHMTAYSLSNVDTSSPHFGSNTDNTGTPVVFTYTNAPIGAISLGALVRASSGSTPAGYTSYVTGTYSRHAYLTTPNPIVQNIAVTWDGYGVVDACFRPAPEGGGILFQSDNMFASLFKRPEQEENGLFRPNRKIFIPSLNQIKQLAF